MRFVITEIGSAAINTEAIVTVFVAKGVMLGSEDVPKEARLAAWQVVVSISHEFNGPTYRLAHLPFTPEGHEDAMHARTQLLLLLGSGEFEDGTVLQWSPQMGWGFVDSAAFLDDGDESE